MRDHAWLGLMPARVMWKVPSPYGAPDAVSSLSTVAAPLLAGFCITLEGVIMTAANEFRLAGLALLLLSSATVLLITCVQSGFWARHYFAAPDEIVRWWPDYEASEQRQQMVIAEQRDSYGTYLRWAARARRTYAVGIIALLFGIAAILVPEGRGATAFLRWMSALIVTLSALAEIVWWIRSKSRR